MRDDEREKLWEVVDRIGARNRDKDPEEVERDVAEAIAEARAEERAKKGSHAPDVIAAVLDANTIVSAILVELGISRRILRAAFEKRFTCLSSAVIVAEVLRVLARPRVQRKYRIHPSEVEELRVFLESEAVSVTIIAENRGVATHPEDDLILATTVSAGADYLVTGDRQLQALGSVRGVTIVSPRQFLAMLEESEAS